MHGNFEQVTESDKVDLIQIYIFIFKIDTTKDYLVLYCRDCWYLYTLNPLDKYLSGHVDVEPDQTIEILMQDLDPKVMEKFSKKTVANGKEATMVSFKCW